MNAADDFCACPSPRPASVEVCLSCGLKTVPGSKPDYDTLTDAELLRRVHSVERQVRQQQLEIRVLKDALRIRAASRERA